MTRLFECDRCKKQTRLFSQAGSAAPILRPLTYTIKAEVTANRNNGTEDVIFGEFCEDCKKAIVLFAKTPPSVPNKPTEVNEQ
jgi:hypothetical protein